MEELVIEKRKRGRPRLNPEMAKVQKKKTKTGKRGRPRRETPKEEVLTYNSTPRELKMALAQKYLEMREGIISDEIKSKYFNILNEIPIEEFSGKGFEIYRDALFKAKE
jgi:hypothetical protein